MHTHTLPLHFERQHLNDGYFSPQYISIKRCRQTLSTFCTCGTMAIRRSGVRSPFNRFTEGVIQERKPTQYQNAYWINMEGNTSVLSVKISRASIFAFICLPIPPQHMRVKVPPLSKKIPPPHTHTHAPASLITRSSHIQKVHKETLWWGETQQHPPARSLPPHNPFAPPRLSRSLISRSCDVNGISHCPQSLANTGLVITQSCNKHFSRVPLIPLPLFNTSVVLTGKKSLH